MPIDYKTIILSIQVHATDSYQCKLVLFEFMYVQRLYIWRQITRSIISLLKDLMMKPDTKSLLYFQ